MFRFVTQGPAWRHIAASFPLGLAAGTVVAWWMTSMVRRESAGTRSLSGWASGAIVLGTGLVYTALVLAVTHGQCQWITEGGSVDWGHWRLLYHYVLIGLLIAATTIDFDQYIIPDEITVAGAIVGIAAAVL